MRLSLRAVHTAWNEAQSEGSTCCMERGSVRGQYTLHYNGQTLLALCISLLQILHVVSFITSSAMSIVSTACSTMHDIIGTRFESQQVRLLHLSYTYLEEQQESSGERDEFELFKSNFTLLELKTGMYLLRREAGEEGREAGEREREGYRGGEREHWNYIYVRTTGTHDILE